MRPTMIQRLAMAISLAASLVLPATVLAQSNCDEADFNQDGEVNGADLTILLGYWGPCPVPSIATVTGVVRLEGGVAVANASVTSGAAPPAAPTARSPCRCRSRRGRPAPRSSR
jgi:hypothetical protein